MTPKISGSQRKALLRILIRDPARKTGQQLYEKYAPCQTAQSLGNTVHHSENAVLFTVRRHQRDQRKMRYLKECEEYRIHDIVQKEHVYVLEHSRKTRRHPEKQHE